jgi:hypothetical protein
LLNSEIELQEDTVKAIVLKLEDEGGVTVRMFEINEGARVYNLDNYEDTDVTENGQKSKNVQISRIMLGKMMKNLTRQLLS